LSYGNPRRRTRSFPSQETPFIFGTDVATPTGAVLQKEAIPHKEYTPLDGTPAEGTTNYKRRNGTTSRRFSSFDEA
jgi:hypothetical protein